MMVFFLGAAAGCGSSTESTEVVPATEELIKEQEEAQKQVNIEEKKHYRQNLK